MMPNPRKDSGVEQLTITKQEDGFTINLAYTDGKAATFSCDKGANGYDLKEAFVATLLQLYGFPGGAIPENIREQLFVDNVTYFKDEIAELLKQKLGERLFK